MADQAQQPAGGGPKVPHHELKFFKWIGIAFLVLILWWLTGIRGVVGKFFSSLSQYGVPGAEFFAEYKLLGTLLLVGAGFLIWTVITTKKAAPVGEFVAKSIKGLINWVFFWIFMGLNIILAILAVYILSPTAPRGAYFSPVGRVALLGAVVALAGLGICSLLGWLKGDLGRKITVAIYVVTLLICLARVYNFSTSRIGVQVANRGVATQQLVHDLIKVNEPVALNSALYDVKARIIGLEIGGLVGELHVIEQQLAEKGLPSLTEVQKSRIREIDAKLPQLRAQLEQAKLSPSFPEGEKKWFKAILLFVLAGVVIALAFYFLPKVKAVRTGVVIIVVLILGVIFWYNFGIGKISWLSRPRSYEVLSLRDGMGGDTERFFSLGEVAKIDVLKGRVQYKNLKMDPSKIYTFKIRTPGKLYFVGVEGGGKVKVMYR